MNTAKTSICLQWSCVCKNDHATRFGSPTRLARRGRGMQAEPIYDIAHLGHVEILTDKPEASLDFFTRIFGLIESGREGDSVYLRAFDDYEFHSLKLTATKTTGIRHAAFRAASPQALDRRGRTIAALG